MDAEARRAVNRLNAQKSTGPATAEGKARSRRNALKHGLTAVVVDPAGAGSVACHGADPAATDWMADQVARVQGQIVRAQRIEGKLRDEAAWRAGSLWETDRRVAAEELGADLGRAPGRTVARLRRTPQGCDWLIERWEILARAAAVGQAWSEDQVRLAFDLLGTPGEGRVGLPTAAEAEADGGRLIGELAQAALLDLAAQRAVVAEADEVEQALAIADCRDTPTPELARLRRYELALVRRLQWLLAERGDPPLAGEADAPRPATAPAVAGRNEANSPAPPAETKPTAAVARPIAPPAMPPAAPRHRPDLARLERQARKQRQKAGRKHRSA